MKKYILIILLAYMSRSQAQNPNLDYKSAIKIYNVTSFDLNNYNNGPSSGYYYQVDKSTTQILHPSVAFQWKTKSRNFHEIELSNFSVKTVIDRVAIVDGTTGKVAYVESGGREVTTFISAGYEYNLLLTRKSDSKPDKRLVPFLGLGLNPYYIRNSSYAEASDRYTTFESRTGFKTFITPRLNYFFKSRVFLDLNVPFCILDGHVAVRTNRNPLIPSNQQTITNFDFSALPSFYSIRLGIGIKL
jgi:hypothetical protein